MLDQLFRSRSRTRMAIEQYLVPRGSAEKPIRRHAECFPGQVPQRDVNAGQRRLQHRSCAPEGAAKDVLPDVLDPGRVLPHQQGLQVFQNADHGERPAAERAFPNAV